MLFLNDNRWPHQVYDKEEMRDPFSLIFSRLCPVYIEAQMWRDWHGSFKKRKQKSYPPVIGQSSYDEENGYDGDIGIHG